MEEKTLFFYKQNLKLNKNNTFNNLFCNRIFPYYHFLPIFGKLLDFYKSWLLRGKYSLKLFIKLHRSE